MGLPPSATLTTLPLPLQTRILSHLLPSHPFSMRTNRTTSRFWLPFRDPFISLNLTCGGTLSLQLPSALLSPALASPALAAAAARLLGCRVSYLTHANTGGALELWLQAFAPYVRGVCVSDPLPGWYTDFRGAEFLDWFDALVTQQKRSIGLVKALAVEQCSIEVLDLTDVPFLIICDHQDELMAGLCVALESNAGTLRELGLPVFHTSDICEQALEMTSLKRLDVLTVKLWNLQVYDGEERVFLAPPFLRMLRAVDGHADRTNKLTTLRELRFLNVSLLGYDFLTSQDSSRAIFASVRTLRVAIKRSQGYFLEETMHFIDHFTNLERLFTNMNPRSTDTIVENICSRLSEAHFFRTRWITAPIQAGAVHHFDDASLFFGETPAKRPDLRAVRSILAGDMPNVELRNMVRHCTRLENVSLHITKDNMRGIRRAVHKCKHLKCLEIVFDERRHGTLGEDEWRAISQIIPESHKLRQLAIQTVSRGAKPTPHLDAVFACLRTTTKAIGAQAIRLAYRVVFRTRSGVRLIEKVCGLLNTCLTHTPALESLECKLLLQNYDTDHYEQEREQVFVRRLAKLENRILCEIQSLRLLDLGVSPWLREKMGKHDMVETCSVCSERDSTSVSMQTT